jgi:hypothetical protein
VRLEVEGTEAALSERATVMTNAPLSTVESGILGFSAFLVMLYGLCWFFQRKEEQVRQCEWFLEVSLT